jgi:hypothetical protein
MHGMLDRNKLIWWWWTCVMASGGFLECLRTGYNFRSPESREGCFVLTERGRINHWKIWVIQGTGVVG